MYTRDLPVYLVRALAPPRFAAGVLVTLALLSAACSDQASRITSAQHLSNFATASVSALPSGFTLGAAANFVVLGGAGVTCTATTTTTPSTITGDVGSVLTFTNNPPVCTINGAIHEGDQAALDGYKAYYAAWLSLNALTCPSADPAYNLSGELGGVSLSPGLYCITGVGLLTSQLTLNGGATDTWIFKAASSITPSGGGSVVMAGGGSTCNVYWQLGSDATFTNTQFVGNVIAYSDITFTGGSSLAGRALAGTAVTMAEGTTVTPCSGGTGGGNDNNKDHDKQKCNQGVGNGPENCDPGNSNHRHGSNDENGGTRGDPGRKGGGH